MVEEPVEKEITRFSHGTKNFFKSKSLFLIIALGAVIILFVGFGPASLSTGSFLASAFDLARRTFAPGEILVGEIPSGEFAKPSVKANFVSAPSAKSAKSAPKPAGAVSQTNFSNNNPVQSQPSSKSSEIKELNDKINSLQTQISNLAAVPTPSPATSSLTSNSSSSPQAQAQTPVSQNPAPTVTPTGAGRILISEIMAGAEGNANYEFIEIYNVGSAAVDLTGWSIKKKSSTGSESSLVATSRLSGKVIQSNHYFLFGNGAGYQGNVPLDVAWPSYTLAYKNNAVVVYNSSGNKVEELTWTEIPAGQSLVRNGWANNQFTLTGSPTPQNSQNP